MISVANIIKNLIRLIHSFHSKIHGIH